MVGELAPTVFYGKKKVGELAPMVFNLHVIFVQVIYPPDLA